MVWFVVRFGSVSLLSFPFVMCHLNLKKIVCLSFFVSETKKTAPVNNVCILFRVFLVLLSILKLMVLNVKTIRIKSSITNTIRV